MKRFFLLFTLTISYIGCYAYDSHKSAIIPTIKSARDQISNASRQKDPIHLMSTIYVLLHVGINTQDIIDDVMARPILKLYKQDMAVASKNNQISKIDFDIFTFGQDSPINKCKLEFLDKKLKSAVLKATCQYDKLNTILHFKLEKIDNAWKIEDIFYINIKKTLAEILKNDK